MINTERCKTGWEIIQAKEIQCSLSDWYYWQCTWSTSALFIVVLKSWRKEEERRGEERRGEERTGQDRTGQDRTGQGRAGQGRAEQDRTGQDRTGDTAC